jgi:flagellar basal-body rod modification protein FlgD
MQVQSADPFAAFAASTAPGGANSSTPTTAASSAASSAAGANSAPTESMFLQLLVAQMKNQDPTSPQDPTQFVGELAQFSQLEQTLGIKTDTDTIVQDLSSAASAASGTTPASTTTPTTPTNTTPTI